MTLEDLATENEQLRADNAALKQRLAELEALVKALQAQLEAALRAGKRQAALRGNVWP
jgi:regulator of replication initiation timing